MTQEQRTDFLIRCLLEERNEYQGIPLPSGLAEKERLLRGLMNVRPPRPMRISCVCRTLTLGSVSPSVV